MTCPHHPLYDLLSGIRRKGLTYWAFIGGIALLFLVAGLALWRWRWAYERKDAVWERIRSNGFIRVGMDASFPPFEVVNEAGEFAGYDVDLAWELTRRLGLPSVAFVNIHFDGLYDALLEGKCDIIISALPYNRDLTQDVAYSPSYFNAGQRLLVRGENRIEEPGDLLADKTRPKKIAVEIGSEAHYAARELARKAAGAELLTVYTAVEALQLLQTGQADAVVVDAVTAYMYASRHGDVHVVSKPLTDEPYVIAMPLDSPHLMREISRALSVIAAEGYLERLRDKWLRGE